MTEFEINTVGIEPKVLYCFCMKNISREHRKPAIVEPEAIIIHEVISSDMATVWVQAM